MKGQYMAVEYVMIFGLGITVTIGAIAAFDSLRGEIADTSQEAETEAILSQLNTQINNFNAVEQGVAQKQIELPENIGDVSYEIMLDGNEISIISRYGTESRTINNTAMNYDLEGTASGGEVTLFRTDDTYSITEG